MKELVRSTDMVAISALKAVLASEGVEVFELDGDISSTYGGISSFPRRLMVKSEDLEAAAEISRTLFPDLFE